MKKIFVYKKWSYLAFLNNLIISVFFSYSKQLMFLHTDIYKFKFWFFTKKKKKIKKKILQEH